MSNIPDLQFGSALDYSTVHKGLLEMGSLIVDIQGLSKRYVSDEAFEALRQAIDGLAFWTGRHFKNKVAMANLKAFAPSLYAQRHILTKFHMGDAPENKTQLLAALKLRGITVKDLHDLGLACITMSDDLMAGTSSTKLSKTNRLANITASPFPVVAAVTAIHMEELQANKGASTWQLQKQLITALRSRVSTKKTDPDVKRHLAIRKRLDRFNKELSSANCDQLAFRSVVVGMFF